MTTHTRAKPNFLSLVAVPTAPIWRLSIEQYHQMIDTGILTDDDPVELLEGWLVTKMAKNPRHRLSTQLTREAIAERLPHGWFVEDQEPITLPDSEPEPDIAIIRGTRRDYAERHPSADDIGLVVEVSDATLQRDRTIKQQIYARAGLSSYWIINLVEQCLELYTHPIVQGNNASYQDCQIVALDDSVIFILDSFQSEPIQVREFFQ